MPIIWLLLLAPEHIGLKFDGINGLIRRIRIFDQKLFSITVSLELYSFQRELWS